MKLIQSFILYAILFIVRLIIVVLGLLVVPLAYLMRKGVHFPKWAWSWDNKEDGIYGPEWFNNGVYNFKSCFLWSAVRNPANNMRFVDVFNVEHRENIKNVIYGYYVTPNPGASRRLRKAVWHLTLVRQKGVWYFSFWYLKAFDNDRHFRIRLGWKCTPEWIENPRADIYKYSGMTFQFMPYRKG